MTPTTSTVTVTVTRERTSIPRWWCRARDGSWIRV